MLLIEINDELSDIPLIPATKVVRKTCSIFFFYQKPTSQLIFYPKHLYNSLNSLTNP
jgi:hypothetical protein